MSDRQVRERAAQLCQQDHPDMDFELRFYRRGSGKFRCGISPDLRDAYIAKAKQSLGV